MRGGVFAFVKPFHNGLLMRKLLENLILNMPYIKKLCELMRAKLPHKMLGKAKIHCAAASELFLSIIVTIVIPECEVLRINKDVIKFDNK